MYITVIAAMDQNRLIGNDHAIPWLGKMKADMARFRRATMGHPVIMGRKTFEAIGRPLTGRTNIVLSANTVLPKAAGIVPARTKDEALLFAQGSPGSENIFIIGGANVYAQFLGQANTLLLTKIEATFAGNIFFPDYDKSAWELTFDRSYPKDRENEFPYTFYLFDRRSV